MSVQKYHDVAEMPPLKRVTGDKLASRIRAVWARSRLLTKYSYTPGVLKFANIEEANHAREDGLCARARMQRTQSNKQR